MKVSTLLPLIFGFITKISATPVVSGLDDCDGAVTLASNWIGEGNNVEMRTVFCPNLHQHHDTLVQWQATNAKNVCGANCATNCFTPAGGGPDPNDCHVIADALRYNSQSIGALFQIGNTPSSNVVTMQYNSCKTFFSHFPNGKYLSNANNDAFQAALIDFVAPNCQATQNAHGGNCVANDQTWFVQVQHV